jgi:signal transduction histidine kinase
VANLVMNSLIHGFEGVSHGEIRIDVTLEDKMVIFVYSDNGTGMDPGQLEKVFDPFYTTMRGHGGTGLGMSIVFNLVTRTLQGSINCESTKGNGVRFSIKFPSHLSDA